MLIIETRVEGEEWQKSGELALSSVPESFLHGGLLYLCARLLVERYILKESAPAALLNANGEVRATLDGRELVSMNTYDAMMLAWNK